MRRAVATVLVLVLALQQAACMTAPRPIASPQTFIATKKPERVWLTDADGNRVQVNAPRVLGDTLYGRTPGGDEVWLPIDKTRILARELDTTKTFAVVGGTALAGIFLMTLIGSTGPEDPPENVDKPFIGIILFRR
jgi:hypothetical protein